MLTGGLLATLALVLAGCSGTGNFDVQQTEPFRVQLEGEPQTVVVDEDDDEAKQVVIDTCNDPCEGDRQPEEVTVKVQVTSKTVEEACVVKVIIKDRDTGEVLEEREVSTGGSGSGGSGSTSTVTQTQTATVTETHTGSSSGGITVENIVVNVKGKDNIVVLTQAIQGSADVDISAASARGNADADASIDDGATASQTMTATSGNATQSNTGTGTPP